MEWTEKEIEILKNNIQKNSQEISLILNRGRRSIMKKLKNLGLVNEYKKYNEFLGKYSDPDKESERRKRISETCKANKKSGGLRLGSGRGKKGTYKGYWCDSSYELAWVIYQLDHDVKFERNTEKFKYYYNGEEKNYIPDFIVNGIYYETKGYDDGSVEFKLKYFPHKIVILYENDLKSIFDYVTSKYGRNFISLYDDQKYKSCSVCNGYINRDNKGGVCILCVNKSREHKKIEKRDRKIQNKKCECGSLIYITSVKCKSCYDVSQRKVKERPDYEILLREVEELGYSAVGRKYGVSDNAIRKWLK
jgi:hypothetical protein